MKFTLYLTTPQMMGSNRVKAWLATLEAAKLPAPEVIIDYHAAMKVADGKLNPLAGGVLVAPDGTRLFINSHLTDWLKAQ